MSHVKECHPTFESDMRSSQGISVSLEFIPQKALNATVRIDFILSTDLSFSIVEDKTIKLFTKHSVTWSSLMEYMEIRFCQI